MRSSAVRPSNHTEKARIHLVGLVDNQDRERGHENRVGPPLAGEHHGHQEQLHNPVTGEIERRTRAVINRQGLGPVNESLSNDVVRILKQFVLGEAADEAEDDIAR